MWHVQVYRTRPVMLPPGPVAVVTFRGYVLLAHAAGNVLFNATLLANVGPSQMLAEATASIGELRDGDRGGVGDGRRGQEGGGGLSGVPLAQCAVLWCGVLCLASMNIEF